MNDDSSAPKFAAYRVTNRCVNNCEFCIAPNENINDLDTSNSKKVIKRLADSGIEIISMAGKEPLLRQDIFELIQYAKNLGCLVVLETNFNILEEYLRDLKDAEPDWLSVSIDSFKKSTCESIKRLYVSPEKFYRISDKCREYGMKLKLNSVVSAVNRNDLSDIGNILQKSPPEVWKLLQFVPRGAAARVKDKYDIKDSEFLQIVGLIRDEFEGVLNIEYKTIHESDGTCFMILSDGRIVQPTGKTYKIIGNALNDDINRIWNKNYCNKTEHYNNVKRTYDL